MFRIGEFTKIAQVSGRLLRYYDEIGLLTPSHTDKFTGYRYYTADQLPRLNRILALKDLGLTLDQIATLLDDNISADEIRGMLRLQKMQIEQRLRDDVDRLRHVEMRLEQIEEEGEIWKYDVVLKEIPDQPFLSMRLTDASGEEVTRYFNELTHLLTDGRTKFKFGQPVGILHSEAYVEDNLDMELGILVEGKPPADSLMLPSKQQLTLGVLPGAPAMATLICQPEDKWAVVYNAIGAWIDANGYEINGPGREMYLSTAANIFEVQFPVQKLTHELRLT